MHCNVGAYSRNFEILYIFFTSHSLVSSYILHIDSDGILCTCDRYGNNINYYHRQDSDRFDHAHDYICNGCDMLSSVKRDCGRG